MAYVICPRQFLQNHVTHVLLDHSVAIFWRYGQFFSRSATIKTSLFKIGEKTASTVPFCDVMS